MAQNQVAKLSSRHEDIMNYILANPLVSLGDIAGKFGVTQPWLSVIINSDVFKELLSQRREEIFDVAVLQGIDVKLEAAIDMGLDKYLEKIPTMTTEQVTNGTDKLLGRMGFGSNGSGAAGPTINAKNVQINGNVSPDLLAEARTRIGQVKSEVQIDQIEMGQADPEAALPGGASEDRGEEERLAIRAEGS